MPLSKREEHISLKVGQNTTNSLTVISRQERQSSLISKMKAILLEFNGRRSMVSLRMLFTEEESIMTTIFESSELTCIRYSKRKLSEVRRSSPMSLLSLNRNKLKTLMSLSIRFLKLILLNYSVCLQTLTEVSRDSIVFRL